MAKASNDFIKQYVESFGYKLLNEVNGSKETMPLPFDFYLPQYNVLIEFDGEQHFRENRFKGTKLKDIQERDNIKTNYCKNNDIKLIRIPYWDFDKTEEIICQELNLNK